MKRNANTLRLEIADQGGGIPPDVLEKIDESPVALGVGIAGMRERVKQLGGNLDIRSGARGTVIKVRLPVAASVSSPAQL